MSLVTAVGDIGADLRTLQNACFRRGDNIAGTAILGYSTLNLLEADPAA